MSTDLLFERTAGGMRLADQDTIDALAKIPVGQLFSATLHTKGKARSLRHHRLFRGLLSKVAEATGTWPNGDALLGVLKVSLGYYDVYPGLDGQPQIHTRSTGFSAMPQESFARFFDDAVRLLAVEVFPEIADMPEAIEIFNMLDGNQTRDAA